MEETEWLCDQIGIMVNGDFKAIGTKQQLVKRNASGYSLEISISGMNDAQGIAHLQIPFVAHPFLCESRFLLNTVS